MSMNNTFALDLSLDVSLLGDVGDWTRFVDGLGAVNISVSGDWNQLLLSNSGNNRDLTSSVDNTVMLLGHSDWGFNDVLVVGDSWASSDDMLPNTGWSLVRANRSMSTNKILRDMRSTLMNTNHMRSLVVRWSNGNMSNSSGRSGGNQQWNKDQELK